MEINVAGLVVLIVFYVIILVVGVTAAKCVKIDEENKSEMASVAGRQLYGVVGIFTMIATTVGGGFINGTAESIATGGLAWTISPMAIFVGLVLGGIIYAGRMRERKYVTMLQPIEECYGRVVACLVYLATLCGDVFWTASILNALGTSLSIILGINVETAIVVSASITVLYTMIGQMISVAYTDIVQLILITVGLVLAIPFVVTDERVGDVSTTSDAWLGSLDGRHAVAWVDLALAMIFGTIPWQSYFQRVLSVRSVREAQILSVLAGMGTLVLAVPPFLIGALSTAADWSNSSLTGGLDPVSANMSSMILPLVLKEFTPSAVSIIGLGAISAAVMSSMDSSILGSSSMFTHNVYRTAIRAQASEQELMWVQRLSILAIGIIATVLSIFVRTVWGLFVLAADIVFVIVLPQLTCALFLPATNGYGGIVGFTLGTVLRIGAGESFLDLPPFIYYPFYDHDVPEQLFPFRSFAFVVSLLGLIIISYMMKFLFEKEILHPKYDFLGALDSGCVDITLTYTDTNRGLALDKVHMPEKLPGTANDIAVVRHKQ
ncbi:high-affinity choline transporter 1-like [Haliotis rufescens]|uniref:high-affinity choline transporter 1-like n=1 Tax=Haliotis rufescens TaxID=6454 RepID=UPI00201FAA1A|nr:high-affinity choline transporter 1-like [Haliotis rufescens]XP_048246678.1 high-affinity choline transporter 1-like [Haliotis rufescens]